MIWKITVIILLNLFQANTKMAEYPSTYRNSIQHTTRNLFSEYLISFDRSSENDDPVIKKLKTPEVLVSRLSLTSSRSRLPDTTSITPKSLIDDTVSSSTMRISRLFESWLLNANNGSNDSRRLNWRKIVKPSRYDGVTRFLQLWKEIRDLNAGNFTLINASVHVYDLYASNSSGDGSYERRVVTIGEPTMKEILVKDRRYLSFIEKWITNRHGRDLVVNNTSSRSTKEDAEIGKSDVMNSTIHRNACTSYLNESKNLPDLSTNCSYRGCSANTSYDNYTRSDAPELQIHCNGSAETTNNPESKINSDDAEAKVYDPLMPYPEEYPEEYQTIQNGPALIISRTTYTRIPNVTYTTITIVTLPTYRLVEKAEDGFAATLFDRRSSSARGCREFSFWQALRRKRGL